MLLNWLKSNYKFKASKQTQKSLRTYVHALNYFILRIRYKVMGGGATSWRIIVGQVGIVGIVGVVRLTEKNGC